MSIQADRDTPLGQSAKLSDTAQRKVLIVGDEPWFVDLLGKMLRPAGLALREARSGHEAMAEAERWIPDIMVQDGFEITRYVHGQHRTAPAIFLTPKAQLLHGVPGLTLGGGIYLAKPFSSEQLSLVK